MKRLILLVLTASLNILSSSITCSCGFPDIVSLSWDSIARLSLVDIDSINNYASGFSNPATGFGNDPFTPDRVSMPFDSAAIIKALGPSFGKHITYIDIFTKILTGLKKKSLAVRDALGFIERMSMQFGTDPCPHVKLFGNILEIYDMYKDKQNLDALQDFMRTGLDLFFYSYTGKEEQHVTSEKLAPLLTKLIQSTVDSAKSAAKNIAKMLWSDPEIQAEIQHSSIIRTRFGVSREVLPYTRVIQTLQSLKQND